MFIDSRTYELGQPSGARKIVWDVMHEHREWLSTAQITNFVQERLRSSGEPHCGSQIIRQALYGLEATGWIDKGEVGPQRYQWRIGKHCQSWTVEYRLEAELGSEE